MRKKHLQLCAGILVGNLSIALGVAAFIVPNHIIMGGSTGISLVLELSLIHISEPTRP